ncbi:hypothetical protein DBY21_02575 [Candidatus Gastranaerophilales bacterium]|nr:MAG: hypothetical protein DBY21_02575 [Candidatus Gastranaerophilales bacterium]
MYNIKNQIFTNMTKTQKSALCNFLRALVKKSPNIDIDKLYDSFEEDERYYFEINNPHFEFLEDYLDDEDFRREALMYLKECRKYYDYKKSQEPIIQAQKEFEKKKRAFLREVKMSHEEPTKKQKFYYERLCKKYGIEPRELNSKLDARNEIDRILEEHENDYNIELEE